MRPERQTVLNSVARVRAGIDPHRHMPFGQHVMRIPEQDFYALCKFYPALMATDPHEKSAAWEAFEKSPFSEPYRVGRIVKGVTKNGLILP